jgi:hypothetical protein
LILPTFHLPEETDSLCPIMEAIEDIIPGGLSSLVTSGGGGISGILSNEKLKSIPNFNKLTTNYQKFLNLPIPRECPLLLG